MLTSKKLELRRSEIRQSLAELANIENPSEDELRKMGELDTEYRTKESQYRAALVAEDEERREAGRDLETRDGKEWSDILSKFEVRQVALCIAEDGRALEGETAEVVEEMRAAGGYKGIPVPYEALQLRAGETLASGVPDPVQTMPIIDRIFADSVASRMGGQTIKIPSGAREWPVVTSNVTAGWAATETGNVTAPAAFVTTDRPMAPDHTLGVQMKLTRKSMLQTGPALEQAVRRDMRSAIRVKLDQAVFQGTGSSGEPSGVIAGASGYGITVTAINAAASYAAFRSAAVRFMAANAANGPGSVNLLVRPEIYDGMDNTAWDAGSGITEWDRLVAKIGNAVMSTNALGAPAGSPAESVGLMTTRTDGVAPFFTGIYGGIDMIRDTYSGAASGAVTLTGLITVDVTVARPAQLQILTDLR